MPPELAVKPLGEVLQQAGLISKSQVNIALQEQVATRHRLGQMLCEHGWVRDETVEFFVEKWPTLSTRPSQFPIGEYLRQADLLSRTQIDYLLEQQRLTQLRFGVLAVANGWVNLETINFFVNTLHQPDEKSPQPPLDDQLETHEVDTPEYWQRLRENFLESKYAHPFLLLQIYEQALTQQHVSSTGSFEEDVLVDLGLVTRENNYLVIARSLFKTVFNKDWVAQELSSQKPYDRIRLNFLQLTTMGTYPYRILESILVWTNNHPILTQMLADQVCSGAFIQAGQEPIVVEQIVQDTILRPWKTGVALPHFIDLESQILNHATCDPHELLNDYQTVWSQCQIPATETKTEKELLRLGLYIQNEQHVKVANSIYRLVFDHIWLEHKRETLLLAEGNDVELPQMSTLGLSAANQSFDDPFDDLDETISLQPELVQEFKSGKRSWSIPRIVFVALCGAGAAVAGLTFWNFQKNQFSNPFAAKQLNVNRTLEQKKQLPALQIREQPTSPYQQAFLGPPDQPDQQIPIFSPGTQEDEIQLKLGEPTRVRPGYWPNSYSFLYKNVYLNQVDFGFLFDQDTRRLMQTEAAFDQAAGLQTLTPAMRGMLLGKLPEEVATQLNLVFQREVHKYEFQQGNLKGIIQRNQEDRIYMAVWDADFH